MYERGDQGETTCLSFGPKEIKSRELTLYSRCVNSVISGLQEHFLGIWQKRKSAGVRLEEDGWFNAVNAVCKWWKERMMAPPQKPSPCLPWFREVHPHHTISCLMSNTLHPLATRGAADAILTTQFVIERCFDRRCKEWPVTRDVLLFLAEGSHVVCYHLHVIRVTSVLEYSQKVKDQRRSVNRVQGLRVN